MFANKTLNRSRPQTPDHKQKKASMNFGRVMITANYRAELKINPKEQTMYPRGPDIRNHLNTKAPLDGTLTNSYCLNTNQ